jgi:hypothetical protein
MPMDYEVFEPNDEGLAEIIVRILEKRGYDADFQTSYPQHAIFIKVDSREEADRVSKIIENFMEKFKEQKEGMMITYHYDRTITKLGRLIPETRKKKRQNLDESIKRKIDREEF